MRPIVLPGDGRHIRSTARSDSLRSDFAERTSGSPKQDVAAVTLKEPAFHGSFPCDDDQRHGPLILKVRDVQLSITLGELEPQERVRVVPADDDTVASARFLANAPEELAKAGQILIGWKKLVRPVGLFDMDVGDSRFSAGEEATGEQSVAPLDLLERVISHLAQDILLDEKLVPMRLGGSVLSPTTRQPENGSFSRALAPRDPILGLILPVKRRIHDGLRRRDPFR